jgi:hypothetical protein
MRRLHSQPNAASNTALEATSPIHSADTGKLAPRTFLIAAARDSPLCQTALEEYPPSVKRSYNDLAPRGGLLTNGKRHLSISG